jgi:hypothetical protein
MRLFSCAEFFSWGIAATARTPPNDEQSRIAAALFVSTIERLRTGANDESVLRLVATRRILAPNQPPALPFA